MKVICLGEEVIIDDESLELFNSKKWRFSNDGYVCSGQIVGEKMVLYRLHRLILGAMPGQLVDHISGDKLDCRRANLRFCVHAENMRNRKIHKSNSSGFKGVWYDGGHRAEPWRAQIKFERRKYNLGSFATPEQAHAAYVAAAKRLHGEFARAN